MDLINKYKPQSSNDLIGNTEQIKQLQKWLKKIPKIKDFGSSKFIYYKSIHLYGPTGIGKTVITHILTSEANFTITEFNSSNIKNRKLFKDTIDNTSKLKNVSILFNPQNIQKKIIIVDEVDVIIDNDKNIATELSNYIKNNLTTKIIFISNDYISKSLREFTKKCSKLEFNVFSQNDFIQLSTKIICSELNCNPNIISQSDILYLIEKSQNDTRRFIYLLEEYLLSNLSTSNLSTKDINLGLFEAVEKLYSKNLSIHEQCNLHSMDKTLLPLMIHENYIDFCSKYSKYSDLEQLEQISIVSDSFSISDNIDKKMYTNQEWELYKIHGINSICIPMYHIHKIISPCKNSYKFKFTSTLSKLSTRSSRLNIINPLKIKLNIQETPSFTILTLKKQLENLILNSSNDSIKKGIQLLIIYNLDISDFSNILKIYNINKDKPKYTSKMNAELNEKYEKEFDKQPKIQFI